MGTTPNYSWPFPDPGTDVNVPRDIEALARGVDTTVKQGPPWGEFSGAATQTLTSAFQRITLDTTVSNVGGAMHLSASTVVFDIAGTYLLFGRGLFKPNADACAVVLVTRDKTGALIDQMNVRGYTGSIHVLVMSVRTFAVGDFVDIAGQGNQLGTTPQISGGNLKVVKIGAA